MGSRFACMQLCGGFSEAKRRKERWKQGCMTQFKLSEMPVINSCFVHLNICICQVNSVDFFDVRDDAFNVRIEAECIIVKLMGKLLPILIQKLQQTT